MTIHTLLSVASVVMTVPMSSVFPSNILEAYQPNQYPAPIRLEELQPQYYSSGTKFDHRGSGR